MADRKKTDKCQFLTRSVSSHLSLRGHSLKLYKPQTTRLVWQNFFSQQIIDTWNKLPLSATVSSTN